MKDRTGTPPAGIPASLLDRARAAVPDLDAHWSRYARHVKEISVRPRTVLLKEGDIPKNVFIVKKGCLRASTYARGKEITFQFFFEGDAVASIEGFRAARPSPISITTIEPCILTVLSKEGFDRIARENPDVSRVMMEFVYRRFNDYFLLFLSHLRDTPRQRYLSLIRDEPRILARVPLRYIASYLGITPVSLSRIRSRR